MRAADSLSSGGDDSFLKSHHAKTAWKNMYFTNPSGVYQG